MTGTSAAYHLSRAVSEGRFHGNLKVLEAREFYSGATGRNGGHLTPFLFRDFKANEDAWGKEEAVKCVLLERHTTHSLVKMVQERGLEKDVDLVNGGHFDAFHDKDSEYRFKEDFEAAKAAGVDLRDVRWFTTDEMKSSRTHYPAVYVPAYTFWPQKLVTHLFNIAMENSEPKFSVKLHANTPVTSISSDPCQPNRYWKLHTPRGTLSCRTVLHATNGYTTNLLPQVGIVPIRGQIITTPFEMPAVEASVARASWSMGRNAYWHPRLLEPELGARPATNDARPALYVLGAYSDGSATSDDSQLDP